MARAISKILFILGLYNFLAYLECVKSYAWSKGHSEPDLSSVGGHNVSPLVEIGLTDLPKTGGDRPPRPPRLRQACILGQPTVRSQLVVCFTNVPQLSKGSLISESFSLRLKLLNKLPHHSHQNRC